MEELFDFKTPNGDRLKLTISQARSFGCKEMNQRCDEIVEDRKRQKKKTYKKDSFVPGWQQNIRMHITCPFKYKRALKELGLVEIGNDYIPTQETRDFNPFNSEVVKEAVKLGIELSDREINAMESGEYFKH